MMGTVMEQTEGFGRRQVAENVVEYTLFLANRDGQTTARSRLDQLHGVRKQALELLAQLAGGYIWQRGEFGLDIVSNGGFTYLRGTTDYGDCIEDEWFIVYLLRELTKVVPQLWAHTCDNDGEFLLIEAANAVPEWLNPNLDHNRVWIHRGKLMLIPLISDSGLPLPRNLDLAGAFRSIQTQPTPLVSSETIESEAFQRLEGYPERIASRDHYCLLRIPRKLAYVLHLSPKSVAPAVEAFYLREPIQLGAVASSKHPLKFPIHDLVTIGIRFTKVLFAQLRSQRFSLPTRWENSQNTIRSGHKGSGSQSPEDEQFDLGMKLTIGFELLARHARDSGSRLVREMAVIVDDIDEDGEGVLPTDSDIVAWRNSARQDDDSWLDISHGELEAELSRHDKVPSSQGPAGSGNSEIHGDLRRIVDRFHSFLDDDTAGFDGAEIEPENGDKISQKDEQGEDDGGDSSGSSDDEDEVVLDETEFRRLLGNVAFSDLGSEGIATGSLARDPNPDSLLEGEAIQVLTRNMEAELDAYGLRGLDSQTPRRDNQAEEVGTASGEADVDYHLARNILESFKGQAGLAGPTGNLLAMMGIRLPRDEDEDGGSGTADEGSGPEAGAGNHSTGRS